MTRRFGSRQVALVRCDRERGRGYIGRKETTRQEGEGEVGKKERKWGGRWGGFTVGQVRCRRDVVRMFNGKNVL